MEQLQVLHDLASHAEHVQEGASHSIQLLHGQTPKVRYGLSHGPLQFAASPYRSSLCDAQWHWIF